MIVKTVDDVKGTDAEIATSKWISRRLLLKKDGMGFSFHETIIYARAQIEMQYLNHLEAVFCVEGEGEVQTLADGKVYPITPGTVYALDKHDKHILRAKTEMRMACVFNPPLMGGEIHDKNGAYPLEMKEA